MTAIHFKPPGPVARRFMLSTAFVRALRGPVGSAKSSTCIMEMFRKICTQRAHNGVRKSRWVVTRNTGPMLRTTTMATYKEWIPEENFGAITMAPPPFLHTIKMQLPDGTRIESEVWFLALDTPEDVKKLLSLELTGAFVNEAREVPKAIIDALTQRLRRYPAMKDGGASWSGLIMDTNAPDEDHWWPIMAGEAPPPEGMSDDEIKMLVRPQDWEFFNQPGAMVEVRDGGKLLGYEVSAVAENIQNLDPNYYPGMVAGKSKAWIDVYILNKLGATHDGRPVQSEFNRAIHVSALPLEAVPLVPISWSFDFGLTPAAVAMQRIRGRWLILKEIVLTDASAKELAKAVNRSMTDDFPGHKFAPCFGDPAGDQRAGTDKNTPFQIMRAAGIPCRPTETNDVEIRRAALSIPLMRLEGGEPAILIDPRCRVLIAGLEGAWCYKRVQSTGGSTEYHDEPQKNRYSHVCEAFEYGMLGGGEARELLGRKRDGAKTHNARDKTSPLARFNSVRKGRPSRSGIRGFSNRP